MKKRYTKPTLADGGYLSWTYGSKHGTRMEWMIAREKFRDTSKAIIAMDHQMSFRALLDPSYKSRRRDRDADHQEWADRRAEVNEFVQKHILADSDLNLIQWPGLEADDLIALLSIAYSARYGTPLDVIGVDKDILQLPYTAIAVRRTNFQSVSIANYASKLPKGIRPWIRRGRDVLLSLCLMGDKSDSVDRILPLHHLREMVELLMMPRPFAEAYQRYGEQLKRNLYLTVLPCPWAFEPIVPPDDVIQMVDDGSWWQGTNYSLYDRLHPGLNSLVKYTADRARWFTDEQE